MCSPTPKTLLTHYTKPGLSSLSCLYIWTVVILKAQLKFCQVQEVSPNHLTAIKQQLYLCW